MNIMKSFVLFFSFIAFFALGCKKNPSPLNEFESISEQTIKGKKLIFGDTVLNDPRTIIVHNGKAFLGDNTTNSAFSVVDLDNLKLIRRFAHSGTDSTTFNINAVQMSISQDYKFLYLYQANPPMRIFKYSVDSLLNIDSFYNPQFMYQFSAKLYFNNFLFTNDSTILGQMGLSEFDSNLFGLFNLNSNKLKTGISMNVSSKLKETKIFSKNYLPWTRTELGGWICQKPGAQTFAYFSGKGAVVEFFRIKDNNDFESMRNNVFYMPSFEVLEHSDNTLSPQQNDDNRYGFNSVSATKDKVFALYNGKPSKSHEVANLSTSIILVYSWAGQPIKRIKLDKPCYAIAIDPDNPNVLYALHSFKDISIYKYVLP